jgi:hypothetical protein
MIKKHDDYRHRCPKRIGNIFEEVFSSNTAGCVLVEASEVLPAECVYYTFEGMKCLNKNLKRWESIIRSKHSGLHRNETQSRGFCIAVYYLNVIQGGIA